MKKHLNALLIGLAALALLTAGAAAQFAGDPAPNPTDTHEFEPAVLGPAQVDYDAQPAQFGGPRGPQLGQNVPGRPGPEQIRQFMQQRAQGRRGPQAGGFAGGPGQMGPQRGPQGRPGPDFGNPELLLRSEVRERIDLTDEQAEQLRELVYKTREAQIDLRAEIAKAELNMQRLMEATRPDREAVMQQIETIAGLQAQQAKNEVGQALDVKEVLTDEQLENLEELHQQFRKRASHGFPGGSAMRRPDRDGDGPEGWGPRGDRDERRPRGERGERGERGPRGGRGPAGPPDDAPVTSPEL